MPLPADFFPPISARGNRTDSGEDPPFFGARWAVRLCATLLLLLALTVALRYVLPASPSKVETISQQPVTPEVSAAATRASSDATAPDPGDNLP